MVAKLPDRYGLVRGLVEDGMMSVRDVFVLPRDQSANGFKDDVLKGLIGDKERDGSRPRRPD
ncbi:hypothetical protein FRC15_000250 [Serendipita sp. 397]|nr:hypothetical protein FRC15_000250 [Serendipita sp. 397]